MAGPWVDLIGGLLCIQASRGAVLGFTALCVSGTLHSESSLTGGIFTAGRPVREVRGLWSCPSWRFLVFIWNPLHRGAGLALGFKFNAWGFGLLYLLCMAKRSEASEHSAVLSSFGTEGLPPEAHASIMLVTRS